MILRKWLILFVLLFPGLSFAEYGEELIGIWAMEPVFFTGKNVSNVTVYNVDGSYEMYGFICASGEKVERNTDSNSSGVWSLEGHTIVLTVSDSDELRELEEKATKLRSDMSSMSDNEKLMMRSVLGEQIMDFVEGGELKVKEDILSIDSGIMKSKQKINALREVEITSHKVDAVKPICN